MDGWMDGYDVYNFLLMRKWNSIVGDWDIVLM